MKSWHCNKENVCVRRGSWGDPGQESIQQGRCLWLPCSEGGACAGGTGPREQLQAAWSRKLIHKPSSGTWPFPVLQPHEIFRLLAFAPPYCPPQQIHLPYIIYGCPLPSSEDCREGKIRPWTGVGSVWILGQEQGSSLTPHGARHAAQPWERQGGVGQGGRVAMERHFSA